MSPRTIHNAILAVQDLLCALRALLCAAAVAGALLMPYAAEWAYNRCVLQNSLPPVIR